MKLFVLLQAIIIFWLLLKIVQMGWRLFAVLFFASLITGCATTSNKFDKSPCACAFRQLNTGGYWSKSNA